MNESCKQDRDPPIQPLLEVIRPRFFPGQSLSDKDLTALIDWAEQRWRLAASCDDWGIACGLNVSIDPNDNSRVLISPGYGYNPARQLCVVSDSDCNCKNDSSDKYIGVKSLSYKLPKAACAGCKDDESAKVTLSVGPVEVKESELHIYDLILKPSECQQSSALALSIDGRRQCEPSRYKASAIVESQCYKYSTLTNPPDPEITSSKAIDLLSKYLKIPSIDPYPTDVKSTIKGWLEADFKASPELGVFGVSWKDKINAVNDEAALTDILSWWVFGLRRAQCCNSQSNINEISIPLARVWARCAGAKYEILWIDSSSPHRKRLSCQSRAFRLNDWIGETYESANHAAKLVGITLSEPEAWKTPTTLIALKNILTDEQALNDQLYPGVKLTTQCIDMPAGEARPALSKSIIIAFKSTPPTA